MHERREFSRHEREGRVFYPASRHAEAVLSGLERVFEPVVFSNPETKVEGLENLEKGRCLAEEGKPLVIAANHLSTADYPFTLLFLHHYGFDNLRKNTIFIGRKSLFEDPFFRFFLSVVPVITVYSPREVNSMEEEHKMEALRHNNAALRVAREKQKEGRSLLICPEATRGTTGALLRGHEAVASYWHAPDAHVLPVGIRGTERIWPRKTKRPHFRASVVASVGELIPADRLRREAGHDKQREVDIVMEHIAKLLPPSYQGVYRREQEVTLTA